MAVVCIGAWVGLGSAARAGLAEDIAAKPGQAKALVFAALDANPGQAASIITAALSALPGQPGINLIGAVIPAYPNLAGTVVSAAIAARPESSTEIVAESVRAVLAVPEPTVTPLTTNDTTPTITGTAVVGGGAALTVTVNGVTYTAGDGKLVLVGTNWTLTIPAGNALAAGTYSVTATATGARGKGISDGTSNELVIDPTVTVEKRATLLATVLGAAVAAVPADQQIAMMKAAFKAAPGNVTDVSAALLAAGVLQDRINRVLATIRRATGLEGRPPTDQSDLVHQEEGVSAP